VKLSENLENYPHGDVSELTMEVFIRDAKALEADLARKNQLLWDAYKLMEEAKVLEIKGESLRRDLSQLNQRNPWRLT